MLLSSFSKKLAAKKAFELFKTPLKRYNKPLPLIFKDAENLELIVDTVCIKGWRWNHLAQRKLLILHGFESSVCNFEQYVLPLVQQGYEVLAFDAPAHGKSEGNMITAPLYKNCIKEIFCQFGPVQSFIAHSFGGLAVCLALEEIAHDADSALVLIAPATETTRAIDSFFHVLKLNKAVRPEFDQIIKQQEGRPAEWYSVKRALQQIKASVLWVHDEEDFITPLADVLPVQNSNYPTVQFHISKGLGHNRIYRDKNIQEIVVGFLK